MHRVIKSRWRAAKLLPAPGERWTISDVDGDSALLAKQLKKLQHHDIVKRVDRRKEPSGRRNVYETNAAAWRHIVAEQERQAELPGCEHRGVRNLGDEGFTCTADDCDARFGRDVARERL
jgi:hypothetical protein